MPSRDFPHPLLFKPQAGNREIWVKAAPSLPLTRQNKEERHEKASER